jgi:DNA-binding XRE family transcriptional regulator
MGASRTESDTVAVKTSPARSRHDPPRAARLRWTVDAALLDRERVLHGLSQRQLAKRARVDPATLSDVLCQKRRPNLGTVTALCGALGLELRDVITFS